MRFRWLRSTGTCVAGLAFVALVLAACASPRPIPVVLPDLPLSLAEDEGLLIVQIDTNSSVARISAGASVISENLPKGRHIWIASLPAGRYAWSEVRIEFAGLRNSYRPGQFKRLNEHEFEFDVVAGQINYPGELVIRTDPDSFQFDVYRGHAGYFWDISIRNRNHSAMAIRSLLKSHARLLDDYAVRYAGSSGDGFLAFYAKEKARVRGSAGTSRP